jgi:hypothetical protein
MQATSSVIQDRSREGEGEVAAGNLRWCWICGLRFHLTVRLAIDLGIEGVDGECFFSL